MMIPEPVALATMSMQLAKLAQGRRAAPAPEPEFRPFRLAGRSGAKIRPVELSADDLLPPGALAEVRPARNPGGAVTGRHAVVARPGPAVNANVGRG